jgi:hypothetical protein
MPRYADRPSGLTRGFPRTWRHISIRGELIIIVLKHDACIITESTSYTLHSITWSYKMSTSESSKIRMKEFFLDKPLKILFEMPHNI